jgi:lipopolysaccharide/colanic/teichoic acid biosynthesis glycosyltransferase
MQPELEQLASSEDLKSADVFCREEIVWGQHNKKVISPFYAYWYVVINFIFGFLGLMILLLLLPVLVLTITIDSPGPIFYMQQRLGYRGTLFRMYKFRTMYAVNDHMGKIALTAQHDLRVTRVGHLLRMTHLDELPQIVNILRGEMSLIGPRPELADISSRLNELLPDYHQRLAVKPGLTGLAQVMHHYGDTIEDEKIKLGYDLDYIKNQAWYLDLQIVVRTVREVLLGHGR